MSDKNPKIYSAMQKPGAGKYQCVACPHVVELKDGEALGVCEVCHVSEWIKIS